MYALSSSLPLSHSSSPSLPLYDLLLPDWLSVRHYTNPTNTYKPTYLFYLKYIHTDARWGRVFSLMEYCALRLLLAKGIYKMVFGFCLKKPSEEGRGLQAGRLIIITAFFYLSLSFSFFSKNPLRGFSRSGATLWWNVFNIWISLRRTKDISIIMWQDVLAIVLSVLPSFKSVLFQQGVLLGAVRSICAAQPGFSAWSTIFVWNAFPRC